MKKQLIDISELRTPINFAKAHGVSKQNIYEMISHDRFDIVKIDGTMFIVMNEKAKQYKKNK